MRDVIADKKSIHLWQDRPINDVSRALLGGYQDELLWQPAFLRLLDHLQNHNTLEKGVWLTLLQNIDPECLVPMLRAQAIQIYTTASKGVHHEFVLSVSSYYDPATLSTLTDEVLRLVSTMSLLMNFAETVAYCLPPMTAVKLYEALQP